MFLSRWKSIAAGRPSALIRALIKAPMILSIVRAGSRN